MNNGLLDAPIRSPRERVWDAIRLSVTEFTLDQVANIGGMKIDSARDYLTGLRRAGFIAETRRESKPMTVGGNTKTVYYTLVNDVGHDAPAVNRKGDVLEPRGVNTAMWNALRVCNAVTPRSLAAYSSTETRVVSEETANSYLQVLHDAGYVVVVIAANHARQATYRLLPTKNTGPKPPQISRACRVFDPNVGRVVYQERPEMAEEIRDGVEVQHA
jgi:uncharacterized protein YdbL (DUF1318 family)